MLRVLVVGQTPPPVGGQTIMIQQLINSKPDGLQLIHVRMGFSSNMDEMGRIRLSKILHVFGLIARIIYHRFANDVRILYYPPAGPERVPMFRDVAILLSTRWLFEKTVFHFHAGGVSELYDQLPSWQRWLFRRAYFGADAAIRLSELNPEDGRRLAAKREFVVPNGIIDPVPGLLVSGQESVAITDDRLRILCVGVLSEAKGVMVLVEACAMLVGRGVLFQLEMMGEWESSQFAARAIRRIQELNLDSQIRFLGMLTGREKCAAFRRADLLCFPTHFVGETFGLVLLEAMAFGLPVVSTRWRGIPSVVDDGRTGMLFEPRDAEALAERFATLAHDPQLRERMGRAGRAKFEREYTFARHASRMRRALLETAGLMAAEESGMNGQGNAQQRLVTDATDGATQARGETVMA